jgi:hypothetical protein
MRRCAYAGNGLNEQSALLPPILTLAGKRLTISSLSVCALKRRFEHMPQVGRGAGRSESQHDESQNTKTRVHID